MTTTGTRLNADLLTCEACDRTGDVDEFRAYDNGECDDPICDECLDVHRDAIAADRENRTTYYYR